MSTIVAALAVSGLAKQVGKDHTGGLGDAQAKAVVQWSIQDGRDGPAVDPGIPSLVTPGAWFSGGNIVVTESGRVVAYNRATGKTEWEHPAPSGLFVCGAGEGDTDGIVVVAYGTKEDCSTIEGIDLAKGDKVWSQTVKNAGLGTGDDIAVSGSTVVVNGQAYSMKNGSPLWDSKATFGGSCFGAKYTGGAALVAMGTCKSVTSVYAVDPATGKAKWQYDLKSKGSVGVGSSVVSTSPVVIAERPVGSIQDAPTLTVLDDQGKPAFNVTDGHPITGLMEAGPPYLASDKLLFVPGSDMSGSFGTGAVSANQIVAVDRATGKTVWTMSVSTGMKAFGITTQGEIRPVRVEENGDLLALVTGGQSAFKPAHLVRFAAADGKITNLKEYPVKASVAGAFMTDTVFREKDGQFFYVGYSRSAEFSLKSAADYPQYRVIAMS
ncbi:MAG: PQQ-binding-like beta-propeller repeat protein [Streptomycetaceae bacterium]|nr:PQQ-binding-like beta-propeller repeat protein [Streptomycetaceae bacterium]